MMIKQYIKQGISFTMVVFGLFLIGISVVLVLFLEYTDFYDIIIYCIFLLFGYISYRWGNKIYDKLENSKYEEIVETDKNIELTALDVFIVGDKLREDIKRLILVTTFISSITLVTSLSFIAIYFEEYDLGFVIFGGVMFILTLIIIYLSLNLRRSHTALSHAVEPLQSRLESSL